MRVSLFSLIARVVAPHPVSPLLITRLSGSTSNHWFMNLFPGFGVGKLFILNDFFVRKSIDLNLLGGLGQEGFEKFER